MKSTSVLALAVTWLVVCGFPVNARGEADVVASSASRFAAREIAGGFPCEAKNIHNIDLRVRKASNDVQVDAASKTLSVRIGDCVNWRAVAAEGPGKATVAAVHFAGQAAREKATDKWADVCDYRMPAEQCLVAIGFDRGEYTYTASVNNGGIRKTSDTLKIIIVPCLPPNCKPNPLETLIAIRPVSPTVHR